MRFELESKISEQKKQDLNRRASQDILGGVGLGELPPPAPPPPSALPAVDAIGTPSRVLSVEPPVVMTRGSDGQIAPALPEPVAAAPIQVAAAPAKAEPVKTQPAKVSPQEMAFKNLLRVMLNIGQT